MYCSKVFEQAPIWFLISKIARTILNLYFSNSSKKPYKFAFLNFLVDYEQDF